MSNGVKTIFTDDGDFKGATGCQRPGWEGRHRGRIPLAKHEVKVVSGKGDEVTPLDYSLFKKIILTTVVLTTDG